MDVEDSAGDEPGTRVPEKESRATLPSRGGIRGRIGWDPLEPGLVLVALILVVLASLTPWWGVVLDTTRPGYASSSGVDFGLWSAEDWDFAALPGTVFRRSTVLPWWDFVVEYPEFAAYDDTAILLLALWGGTLALSLYALLSRRVIGPRGRGLPTVAQAAALIAVAAMVILTAVLFPAVADTGSFFGVDGRLSWGPKVGWFVCLAALPFLFFSTAIAWGTDRRLRGHCWFCFREVSGEVCEYCGKHQ